MKNLNAALLLLGSACLGVILGCGGSTQANSVLPPPSSSNPSWVQLASLPVQATALDSFLPFVGSDGYVYYTMASGTFPSLVNSVFRAPLASPGALVDISGTGLPGTEQASHLGNLANGTLLLALTKPGGGLLDVYFWNGSTSSAQWTKITGFSGISSSAVYNFTNDSAGYTYFSPAFSGDIWRNDAPNSTNFTKVMSNLYGITNGGGPSHPTNGGLFAVRVYNLGDGKGDTMWACGEGELDNIALTFSSATNTAYLASATGYTGNCTSIDKSATKIMAFRTHGVNTVNIIDIATRAVTVVPSPNPIPSFSNNQTVGTVRWMAGANWMINNRDGSNNSYMLLSKDDGLTWNDITPGLGANCSGANLNTGAAVSSHYIFARCSGGSFVWIYGPVN